MWVSGFLYLVMFEVLQVFGLLSVDSGSFFCLPLTIIVSVFRVDWVEIREPRSGDLMYANIKTGECLWEAPAAAKV